MLKLKEGISATIEFFERLRAFPSNPDLILKTSSFPLRPFSNRFCLKTDYYFRRNVIEIGIGIILRRSESEFFQTFVIITFISRFNLEN